MQKDSSLSNKKLMDIVEKSGHLYPYGNNYIGYGIPQGSRALELIKNPETKFDNTVIKEISGKKFKMKVDKHISGSGVVFNKKNENIA